MPEGESQGILVDVLMDYRQAEDDHARRKAIALKLGIDSSRIKSYKLRKESLDCRQRTILCQLRFEVGVDDPLPPDPVIRASYPPVKPGTPVAVIAGFGPAGMFAALRCLELGVKPVVFERGKDVSSRRFDLASVLRRGVVQEESNYCFGEGGAGTFSDGKLYTRATKRGSVREVYETFVAHGAPERILTEAHPHIGSNLLPNVVKAIRCSILAAGGEIHFETRVSGLQLSPDGKTVCGVETADGRQIEASAVILATGHSARDVYRYLAGRGIRMEAKSFAVGVRIEHPQHLIDQNRYHLKNNQPRPRELPAARYSLSTTIEGRGVHSFCMCPGGFIVPAATENDEVVVNGMSLSRRDSPFANSGFVVTVTPDDVASFEAEHGILAGVAYQKALEVASSKAGGGLQKAPAQRVSDFIRGRHSSELLETSYFPGITSYPLHELLPGSVSWRMKEGLCFFERKLRGFAGGEAQLIGCETRTSSPLRIPRDPDSMEHVDVKGLYPCGEGAGYAGGIVSAAIDGRKAAEHAAQMLAATR